MLNEISSLSSWIIQNGVPQETLEIIVLIPILATVVSFSRYFLGFKTFGIYAPIILALAYHFTGLGYGLILTTAVITSTIVTYSVLRKIRMHYITRIAINYTVLSVFLIATLMAFENLPVLGFTNFDAINPLMIFSIAALSDFFIKQYVKKTIKGTVRRILETTLVSILGWVIIRSGTITEYIVSNLWILPLLAIINVILGAFKGLRLRDYIRFRSISENVKED
jgi:hypothetical protein